MLYYLTCKTCLLSQFNRTHSIITIYFYRPTFLCIPTPTRRPTSVIVFQKCIALTIIIRMQNILLWHYLSNANYNPPDRISPADNKSNGYSNNTTYKTCQYLLSCILQISLHCHYYNTTTHIFVFVLHCCDMT